jgi:3-deoxy-D-manno-octulosonic-acid transferase
MVNRMGIKPKNLSVFFYNIFLFLLRAGIRIASLWNDKAKLGLEGRNNIFEKLNSELKTNTSEIIWFHCASLGEFEQGRPVMEKIKSEFPDSKIFLTFFSSSGYEIRKNYQGADWVYYLPFDSGKNAMKFLDILKPALVIIVKYDYWFHYLEEINKRKIPLLLISAIFRKEFSFFKWYGTVSRMMLRFFTHLFLQENESLILLGSIGIKNNVTVTGDTRFDRVAAIAADFQPLELVEKFCANADVLVAGSTWPEDEKIIQRACENFRELKLIIAPHEIHPNHLLQLKQEFPTAVYYSELDTGNLKPITGNCLIIDNIGMLSRLYHYATITYVGGGFGKGIHNTLEAAVHGKPVLFGPEFKKFKEAEELVKCEAGICIQNCLDLRHWLNKLLTDRNELKHRSKQAADYITQHRGATEKIVRYIAEKRLLTK